MVMLGCICIWGLHQASLFHVVHLLLPPVGQSTQTHFWVEYKCNIQVLQNAGFPQVSIPNTDKSFLTLNLRGGGHYIKVYKDL